MSDAVIIAIFASVTGITTAIIGAVAGIRSERRKSMPNTVEQQQEFKRPDLTEHPLFSELDSIESRFLRPSFSLGDAGRTELAVELLVNSVRCWRPILLELAKNTQDCFSKCGGKSSPYCNKVETTNLKALEDGIKKYSMWYNGLDDSSHLEVPIKAVRSDRLYREECKSTMAVYMAKFMHWNYQREKLLEIAIKDYAHSAMSEGCYEKQWDIFNTYRWTFNYMKLDAEKTLWHLNGGLTGREFLGLKVGDPTTREDSETK